MIGIGIVMLSLVALGAMITVALVIFVGTRENLDAHVGNSTASMVWQERATRVESARQGLVLVSDNGNVSAAGSAITGSADEAEVRRQAALARKAARASKSAE